MSEARLQESKTENDYSTVFYDCPVCSQQMGVEPHLFGEIISCPNCDHEFKVEPPSAVPSRHRPAHPEELPHINREADEETLLGTYHPAMFRAHPLLYSIYVLGIVLGLGGMIYSFAVVLDPVTFWIIFVTSSIIATVCLCLGLAWWIKTLATTLTVTSKRTRVWRGIFSKETSEVQHDDVRNIQVDQTIWERLFRVGTIAISSSGQDDLEVVVHGIPHPSDIADLIRRRQ